MSRRRKTAGNAMSRRQRNLIIAVVWAIIALVVGLDRLGITRQWQSMPSPQVTQDVNDLGKYDGRRFYVIRAVDGDTLDINAPDGRDSFTKVRLWGMDTPETKDPRTGVMYFGPEASDFTKGLTLHKPITVHLEKKPTRDKYQRLLAYVELEDGRFLNEVLLSEGYAYWDFRFKHSYYNKYQQLESAARSQKKGLWANVTESQLPEYQQKRRPHLVRN